MKHKFQCEYCGVLFNVGIDAERHELTHRVTSDSLGFRLAMARLNKGLSQSKLADITGVSQNNIYSYENNRTVPKVTTLKLLCKALDKTAFDLLGY